MALKFNTHRCIPLVACVHKETVLAQKENNAIRRDVGRVFPSLRSKRFRLVSEQKETVEGDFRFWSREILNENH